MIAFASEMYNEYVETSFDQYMALPDNKKASLVINMILLIYFLLMHIIKTGLKKKNLLIEKKNLVIKKESADLSLNQ